MNPPAKRCAIYTRKSSEEGLEQDFNSLAAQREACFAYVSSQTGEGWRASAALYDDGGYSGGNLDRPGLQRLLADIDAGKIDIVVVYKVDRLTRSLADFAKIVERLEARTTSFVSVTQSFNTTTSMGRLTLNVLLSFAQFEREVTGERIRDKIAASKRKGMWMGGSAPLGYRGAGRTLEIVPEEAEQVRAIYQRYLTLKSVPALVASLTAEGVYSKVSVGKDGRKRGGGAIGVGPTRHILTNRTYRGLIVHRAEVFEGLHPAIVDAALFDAVQAQLSERALPRGAARRRLPSASLTGRVFTDTERSMISSVVGAAKGRAHRYYVPSKARAGDRRIPATLLENVVKEAVARVCGGTEPLRRVERVIVASSLITIELDPGEGDIERSKARLREGENIESDERVWRLSTPLQLRRWRGRTLAFDLGGRPAHAALADAALEKAIGRAWSWRTQLMNGKVDSITTIAKREKLPVPYVLRIFRLAYLAPDLLRAALSGRAPAGLSVDRFVRDDMPRDWTAQRRLFDNANATAN